MTLHATREGQKITIHGNTGVEVLVQSSRLTHVKIDEEAQHVRSFWGMLGRLLDEADVERAGAAVPPG